MCSLVHYLKGFVLLNLRRLWDQYEFLPDFKLSTEKAKVISQQFVSRHAVIFVGASLLQIGSGTVNCSEECFIRALSLQEALPGLSVVCLI